MKKRWSIFLALALLFTCSPVSMGQTALTGQQLNAIAMLNWLTVMSQRISSSRSSRLVLEDIYTEMVNDVDPGSVDDMTLTHMTDLQDTIQAFRMLEVKRNHAEYLREQAEAQAVWDALSSQVDNLSGMLSGAVQSSDDSSAGQNGSKIASLISGLTTASTITAVASAVKTGLHYQQEVSDARLTAIQSNWALDAEEENQLHLLRQSAFSYMVKIARQFGLTANQTLNENAVQALVSMEDETNHALRVSFLETRRKTYDFYGGYWLMLAESYHALGRWQDCLNAIDQYQKLNIGIFRRNLGLANAIPLAIDAVGHLTSDGEKYIEQVTPYLHLLFKNMPDDDWRLSLCSALTLLQISELMSDGWGRFVYIISAVQVLRAQLPVLIQKQRNLNAAWEAPVQLLEIPAGLTRAQKAERTAYNNALKEARKTELPPIYEPLTLYLQLLHEILRDKDDSNFEQIAAQLDEYLHPNGEALFHNLAMEKQSWFSNEQTDEPKKWFNVDLEFSWLSGYHVYFYIQERCTRQDATVVLAAARQTDKGTLENFELFQDAELIRVERGTINWAVYESPSLNKLWYDNYYDQSSNPLTDGVYQEDVGIAASVMANGSSLFWDSVHLQGTSASSIEGNGHRLPKDQENMFLLALIGLYNQMGWSAPQPMISMWKAD